MMGQFAAWLLGSLAVAAVCSATAFWLGAVRAADRGHRAHKAELEMMSNVIQNSQALIGVKDLNGVYLLTNSLFDEAVKGITDSLVGQTAEIFQNEELTEIARVSEAAAMHGPYHFEAFLDVPGGRRYYDSVKFPLHDADGTVYAIGSVARDVTEQKLAVRAAAEARDEALAATAAKSTFLATMSHEIRTPMNAVIGMTDLLLDTTLDDRQREFLTTIHSSGDALLAVINDILDFSKIESGELQLWCEPFALRETIESCLDLVAVPATAKDLDLVCYIDDSCPTDMVGDAARLRQILINLLSNAVKFTADGEVLLTVVATPTLEGRMTITSTITDSGIGIPAAALDGLFSSFTQVDASHTRVYGGTGLGLAISQRLAKAMNGNVTVTSKANVGSTFTAEVVLDPCVGQDGTAERFVPAAPILSGFTAMVVDDNATNLRILELQLTALGLVCVLADSPVAALERAKQGLTCDVAVLDMKMPHMTGLELAIALRRHEATASCPLILLTNEGIGAHPLGTADLFRAVLAKPVKSAALRDALMTALTGRTSETPSAPTSVLQSRPATTMRVLLAEDNLVNQRVAQLMLDKLGHLVETVDNGRSALDAVGRTHFDVILMDVQMPEMDGLEATRLIRDLMPRDRQPYIIAMTASAMVEDRDACVAAGMDGYLTKPVRGEELKAALNPACNIVAGA